MADGRMPYDVLAPVIEDDCMPRLTCPRCGDGGGLHHYVIRVHERVAPCGEDGDGIETSVCGRIVTTRPVSEQKIAGRRNSIMIGFWCEHCDHGEPCGRAPLVLAITQHKGSTYIGWSRVESLESDADNDPDGLHAAFRDALAQEAGR